MNIEWVSEILAKEGYGVLAREFLYPIRDQIKVTAKEDYVKPENKIQGSDYVQNMIKSVAKPGGDAIINFCIPSIYSYKEGKFNIGLSIWESNVLHPSWKAHMERMDAILAPTEYMQNTLQKCLPNTPVLKFNPAFNLDNWNKDGNIMEVSETEGKIKFLVDGSWNVVSDIERLVQAFVLAFQDNKNVALILKMSVEKNGDKRRNIQHGVNAFLGKLLNINNRPTVVLLTDEFESEQKAALYRGCDYFLDITRLEGINFNKIRIKSMGVPVIGMNKSNNKGTSDLIVDSHFEPILEVKTPFFDSNQYWEIANTDSLIETLRSAYDMILHRRNEYEALSKSAEQNVQKHRKTDVLEVVEKAYGERRET